MVDSTTLSAVNAYRNQMKMMSGAGNEGVEEASGGPSFSQLVEKVMSDSAATLQNSENMQMESLTGSGKVDLSDLITAVSSAELTLSTVVAVRDKVIGAYQDIIRMTI